MKNPISEPLPAEMQAEIDREIRRGFLHPRRRKPNYLERRLLLDSLRCLADRLKPGRLLDVGCGIKPYESFLRPPGSEYVGIDYPVTATAQGRPWSKADVFADCREMPFEDASFDSVICTQVLEHVNEPKTFLREIARVLKPGGVLLISVPMSWPHHEEPHDFFRYTRYGLDHLLGESGFATVCCRERGGLVATVIQLSLDAVFEPAGRSLIAKLASNLFSLVLNTVAVFAEACPGKSRICLGFTAVARKR